MKNAALKKTVILLLLPLSAMIGCKKPIQNPEIPESYDKINKVFRVKVNSADITPYLLTIKRSINDEILDFTKIDQKSGTTFEYAFIPAAGETITVTVSSTKKDRITYCHYAGVQTWTVNMVSIDGGYAGKFEYTIPE